MAEVQSNPWSRTNSSSYPCTESEPSHGARPCPLASWSVRSQAENLRGDQLSQWSCVNVRKDRICLISHRETNTTIVAFVAQDIWVEKKMFLPSILFPLNTSLLHFLDYSHFGESGGNSREWQLVDRMTTRVLQLPNRSSDVGRSCAESPWFFRLHRQHYK